MDVNDMKNTEPRVLFVGAGPGDPELITLKGKRLLGEADIVVYAGSLVSPRILEHCRPDCRIVDSAPLSLEKQVEVMTEGARRGDKVVRLHTGDPSLYGAIAEQRRLLEAGGIAVDFVPGVSSFQGTAAALGIEYTVPGGTQTVICTRRTGRTPVSEEESLVRLGAHGSTLVIFLSSGQPEAVRDDLLEAGRAPEIPAACVYRATWEDQKIIRSTLAELPARMRKEGIDRHALIVVGECLDPGDRRSLLYHPSFEHGFRKGNESR